MKEQLGNTTFIHEHFMLENEAARSLYHDVAKGLPIIDYHCHLPPEEIAENRQFENLSELWLEGDHYKWRAMRANGVDEKFCTGDADPYDKFLAFAKTVPYLLRNPIYHWTHLELKRLFGIDSLLNEQSAPEIWAQANEQLADESMRAQGILKHFNVEVVCTTDDPAAALPHHEKYKASNGALKLFPTYRPDKALNIQGGDDFQAWLNALSDVSGISVTNFSSLLEALRKRHDDFGALGCRLSDHGLEQCFGGTTDKATAATIFEKALAGNAVSDEERYSYASYLMVFFGELDAEKGWTKQLHLGAYRNVNSAKLKQLGPDTGYDSISDLPQAHELGSYFDQLESRGAMPKTIIYNLNPAQNYVFASLAGNFQDGSVPGKIQFGSGWWFLDQHEGMEWQINALSSQGLLSRFVGMLTDSRSFLSFPRHEYFRRILCNMLGKDIEKGMIPDDIDLVSRMLKDICYSNARNYFGFYDSE